MKRLAACPRHALLLVPALALSISPACGDAGKLDDQPLSKAEGRTPPVFAPGEVAHGADTSNPATPSPQPPTPEVEPETSYRAPVVTGKYVWSANPSSGRVAIIDAESYEIRAVDAGRKPTFVAA